mmetsp:Transcript_2370/g.8895  ORF Transcript_2370/g.8895 Transcript_2370/m.8895 type:complete len:206 (+) Transcript_2370:1721-2338(+)
MAKQWERCFFTLLMHWFLIVLSSRLPSTMTTALSLEQLIERRRHLHEENARLKQCALEVKQHLIVLNGSLQAARETHQPIKLPQSPLESAPILKAEISSSKKKSRKQKNPTKINNAKDKVEILKMETIAPAATIRAKPELTIHVENPELDEQSGDAVESVSASTRSPDFSQPNTSWLSRNKTAALIALMGTLTAAAFIYSRNTRR